jgi:hypothetical protein
LQAAQLLLTSLILHSITLGNQLEKHSPGDCTSALGPVQNAIKRPGKLEVDRSEKMIIPPSQILAGVKGMFCCPQKYPMTVHEELKF